MIATMITGDTQPEELRKYFRALQRAQRDIDLRPEAYTHFYQNEFPVRFHTTMDTKRWGPGGLGTGTYEQVIACPVQSPSQ